MSLNINIIIGYRLSWFKVPTLFKALLHEVSKHQSGDSNERLLLNRTALKPAFMVAYISICVGHIKSVLTVIKLMHKL